MDKLILLSILGMGGLAFFFAVILALANERLKVKENPKIEELEGSLPGVNCGACGFLSCHEYAEHLANNTAPIDSCKPGGEETQKILAKILGVKPLEVIKKKVVVRCAADASIRKKKAKYSGGKTCAAADLTKGGEVLCGYGCLGYADCKRACPFGAIEMVNGLAKIILEKCVACEKCIGACPRNIISLEEFDKEGRLIYVACSSLDKGPDTRKACSAGCIACKLCERLSKGAFLVTDNLAILDYEKLKGVENKDEVVLKCPTKVIKKLELGEKKEA